MSVISIQIPEELFHGLPIEESDWKDLAQRMLALGLYAERGVSLGYCAEIAKMDQESFIRFIGKYVTSIFRFENEAELLSDIENA